MDFLFCNVKGKKKKVFLRMSMPFPERFKSLINLLDLKNGKNFFLINNDFFLLEGNLKIKIKDSKHFFLWRVWISISKSVFLKNIDPITKKPIDNQFVYQGKLESTLPFHDFLESVNINCFHDNIFGDSLPTIEIQSNGELKEDQINGVSIEKVETWMEKFYSK